MSNPVQNPKKRKTHVYCKTEQVLFDNEQVLSQNEQVLFQNKQLQNSKNGKNNNVVILDFNVVIFLK